MFINTTNIVTNINNYNNEIASLESEYKKINNQVQELKKGWKGIKADAFFSYYEKTYLPALKTAIDDLKKYSEYLTKIPVTYQKLDDSYSSEIKV